MAFSALWPEGRGPEPTPPTVPLQTLRSTATAVSTDRRRAMSPSRCAEWAPASQSLHVLDGEVPYVVTAGNHDYTNFADRMGLINSFLPPSHFERFSWFGGTFEPGHSENSFSTFGAGG